MIKRIASALMAVLLLISSIAFSVSAEGTPEEEMKTQCRRIYQKTLYNTGHSSLMGLCGLMTGYQLWLLDTTKSAEVYNGNGYFDVYAQQAYTSAGNKVRTYPASTYSLAEALYTVTNNGTLDVYNLVACFQWTNTNAGARYGHAVVIHAILDGMVYFVEGFHTSLAGAAGNPIVCSIDEFAAFFGDWTRYEGLILLGKRDYTDYCQTYPTNLFICADNAQMRSLPSDTEANGCSVLRSTGKNEIFQTTAIYEDDQKRLYFRVCDGTDVGYISAESVQIQRINTEGVTAQVVLPQVEQDTPMTLRGKLLSEGSVIRLVTLVITAADGTEIFRAGLEADSRMFDLQEMNDLLTGTILAPGSYTVQLYAQVENYTPEEDQIYIRRQESKVWQSELTVGAQVPETDAEPVISRDIPDGWYWDGQTRYYYQDGAPRVGWFCDNGADYYFQEDGSVTTGWVSINGRYRCFTEAGVMRTGWIETSQGVCYMLSNGVAATGLRQIDGRQYYFGDDHMLVKDTTVIVDSVTYVIDTNGVAMAA